MSDRTTGMCPGDDKDKGVDFSDLGIKAAGDGNPNDCWNYDKYICGNDASTDEKKKHQTNANNVDRKYKVRVMLDNTYSAENGIYDLRVIIHVNGNDRVLNKPTLHKPGVKVSTGDECLKVEGWHRLCVSTLF